MLGHMEFSTGDQEHKEIVHIVTSNDLLQGIENNEYMRILKKILHNSIANTCDANILNWRGDTTDPKEINDLVLELKQMNFKYAMFWFEGNLVHHGVEDRFLEWAKCKTKDWTIMGHILDRNGKCPVLHQQCVIFNLEKLDSDVDFTLLVEEYNDFEASKDHVHDDYTPLWVKSKAGQHTRKIIPESVFDNITWNLLSQGHTVVNVPNSVRNCKDCAYADEDQEETVEWLLDPNIANMTTEEGFALCERIGYDKSRLIDDVVVAKEAVYVTNTDSISKEIILDIDTIICPASGVNQFIHIANNIDTIKKVIWTDFSSLSIWWMKYVLANWRGKDFDDFYYKHKHILESKSPEPETIEVDYKKVKQADKFFDKLDNMVWTKITRLEHVFLQIDIINEYDKILEHVDNSNVFINVTNIYSYDINYIVNKYHRVHNSFHNFLHRLVEQNKNVYFWGDSSNGSRYANPVNISRIGII